MSDLYRIEVFDPKTGSIGLICQERSPEPASQVLKEPWSRCYAASAAGHLDSFQLP